MKKFNKALVAGVMAASMVLFAGCGNGGNDADQQADTDANANNEAAVVLQVGTNAAFEPFEYMDEDEIGRAHV